MSGASAHLASESVNRFGAALITPTRTRQRTNSTRARRGSHSQQTGKPWSKPELSAKAVVNRGIPAFLPRTQSPFRFSLESAHTGKTRR